MSGIREGDRISNYILEQRVGAGSFGEVWRARHHVFDEVVAIKVPTDSQYVRNLQREGVAVHGLRHANIVRAIDLDPYADPPYLVMEYVDGPTLRALIDEHRATIPVDTVAMIMRGVLAALACAHNENLIHRDIKPANIMIASRDSDLRAITNEQVKVTDFGLGRAGDDTTVSIMQSGSMGTDGGRSVAGTLAYMSPEQREGKPLDARSDLYACGIVLFELLTGERPQGGEQPSALRADVPAHLDDVFSRCYTRLTNRFESADAMADAMVGATTGGGARSAPAAASPPPLRGAGDATCPACQGSVLPDDQFCIRCGHQLIVSVPRCAKCHAYVHTRDRFCIMCGNDLRVLNP